MPRKKHTRMGPVLLTLPMAWAPLGNALIVAALVVPLVRKK